MIEQERLINLDELAEITGYSKGYLRKKIDNKEIPFYQFRKGEPIRFNISEVLNAMRKNTNEENKKVNHTLQM